MNYRTWIKVARFHLTDRFTYTVLPWVILAFAFLVWLLIAGSAGGGHLTQIPTGALAAIYGFFLVAGTLIFRSLPFAFALGVSRRSYYAGTALLVISLAAVYGLGLAALQAIEQATDGWGVGLHFFRVAYILPGPWYLTWLTSFVGLALVFIYGMCFALVYRRWHLLGLFAFGTLQVVAALVLVIISFNVHAWPSIGHFFTTIGAAGLTGLLAALTALLLTAGYATMRRITV
jgi:hypothetical protein